MQLALVPAPEQDGNAAEADAEGDEEAEPGAALCRVSSEGAALGVERCPGPGWCCGTSIRRWCQPQLPLHLVGCR